MKLSIAIDIDGTITAQPALFSILSKAVRGSGGKVLIVTSRSNTKEVREHTLKELKSCAVEFDSLIIIPDAADEGLQCPPDELDWHQQYLWQKVAVCLDNNVNAVFEDDEKVISIFRKYAPQIQIYHVIPQTPQQAPSVP